MKTREQYEWLLTKLCKELGEKPYYKSFMADMSDYALLNITNKQLIKLNCIPFTLDELEMELI